MKSFSRSVQYEAHHQEDFEEPIHPIPGRQPQYLSASEAVKAIKSSKFAELFRTQKYF